MANVVAKIRTAETNRVLKESSAKINQSRIAGSAEISAILTQQLSNSSRLNQNELVRTQRIAQLNQDYVIATQDVLDDKTLEFLISHSQIDAPTLTSIFTGFELARASRAKKLNEMRQTNVDEIESRGEIEAKAFETANTIDANRINQVNRDTQLETKQIQSDASDLLRASNADITTQQREIAADQSQAATAENQRLNREANAENQRLNREASAGRRGNDGLSRITDSILALATEETTQQPLVSDGSEIVQQPLLPQTVVPNQQQVIQQPLVPEVNEEEFPSIIPQLSISEIGTLSDLEVTAVNELAISQEVGDVPAVGTNQDATSAEFLTSAQVDLVSKIRANNPPQGEEAGIIPNQQVESINTPSTSEPEILLTPDVIGRIDEFNKVLAEEDEVINPSAFQQSLIDNDVDPANFTVEEFNKALRINQ